MSEFIKIDRGFVATSEVVEVQKNGAGKAILDLRDGTSKVSDEDYEYVVEDLGVVIPNSTGCMGLTIELAHPSEPEVDGKRPVYVSHIPIVAWRVNGRRAIPITYTGDDLRYILNPDGVVEEIDITTFANLGDAIESVRIAAV